MTLPRALLLTLAALGVGACSEAADPAAPETVLTLAVESSRVIGSGHVDTPAGLREFTFHAVQHPNGQQSGSYKVVLPNGAFFEADVTCLSVEGNTGWVGGTIRDSSVSAIIGTTSMFYAIDNGEGAGAEADIVSLAVVNGAVGADFAFCENRPLELPPLTVTDGNVQVR